MSSARADRTQDNKACILHGQKHHFDFVLRRQKATGWSAVICPLPPRHEQTERITLAHNP